MLDYKGGVFCCCFFFSRRGGIQIKLWPIKTVLISYRRRSSFVYPTQKASPVCEFIALFKDACACVFARRINQTMTQIPRLIYQSIEHDALWLSRAIKHIVVYFCCCMLFLSRKADVCHCYRCFGIILNFWDLIFILASHKLFG